MASTPPITEADILEDIVRPARAGLPPDAARSFLQMRFSTGARKQIRRLLHKNNRGKITPAERANLEKYLRVGQFLDLLQAKAKLSLQETHRTEPVPAHPGVSAIPETDVHSQLQTTSPFHACKS